MPKLITEKIAVLGAIDPDAYSTGTEATGWVDMKLFDQLGFVVMVGTLGSGATVDFKLEQATDSSASGKKDITGKAITPLTDAGTDGDKQAIVVVKAAELDEGYRFVRGYMTVAVGAADAGVLVLGADPRYMPASNFDVATVDEIVF
jgi:hypothetical protein